MKKIERTILTAVVKEDIENAHKFCEVDIPKGSELALIKMKGIREPMWMLGPHRVCCQGSVTEQKYLSVEEKVIYLTPKQEELVNAYQDLQRKADGLVFVRYLGHTYFCEGKEDVYRVHLEQKLNIRVLYALERLGLIRSIDDNYQIMSEDEVQQCCLGGRIHLGGIIII